MTDDPARCYGGEDGGPRMSDVTDPLERQIREVFDYFNKIYLSGTDNWLMRQRIGRLLEQIIDITKQVKSEIRFAALEDALAIVIRAAPVGARTFCEIALHDMITKERSR